MSNMSYCRFENTSRDLDDCHVALESLYCCDTQDGNIGRGLSIDEFRRAVQLIGTCRDIIQLTMDELGLEDLEELSDKLIEKALDDANAAYTVAYNEGE